MQLIQDLKIFDGDIKEDDSWNLPGSKEFLMHRIHAYPAKFPAFLTPKIINYLNERGNEINSVADIFCGCGTSALESRIMGINFWGCDINPVATLIAKTKSQVYKAETLVNYFKRITVEAEKGNCLTPDQILSHERINYWFHLENIIELYRILKVIEAVCPVGKYRNFFLTAFSNILKSCSKWLTKSIKPQIDPNKVPAKPLEVFKNQFAVMQKANLELLERSYFKSSVQIETQNFLFIKPKQPFADLIITSPPYVTSYEYADLHQLSTLWLGYASDYKELRKGTIGSEYNYNSKKERHRINPSGQNICFNLDKVDKAKGKAVKKYFEDIDSTVKRTRRVLKNNGHIALIIGNTSYKNVYIDNARYLTHSLIDNGFTNIGIIKRRISSKILTPYRDQLGRFSNDDKGKKVYSHEYLIIAEKKVQQPTC